LPAISASSISLRRRFRSRCTVRLVSSDSTESACRFSEGPVCGQGTAPSAQASEPGGIAARLANQRDIAAFSLVRDPRFALDFPGLPPTIRGVSLDCLLQHFRARCDAGEYSAVPFEIRKVQRQLTMHRAGRQSGQCEGGGKCSKESRS
jgi:hypothetical protein